MTTYIDFFSVAVLKALVIPFHEKKAKTRHVDLEIFTSASEPGLDFQTSKSGCVFPYNSKFQSSLKLKSYWPY